MEQQVPVIIAAKMEEAVTKLDEIVEYLRQKVEPKERAPLLRAIGDIVGIVAHEIKPRLVKANPELHEVLFRGLPKDFPDDLLRTSRYRASTRACTHKTGAGGLSALGVKRKGPTGKSR